MTRGHGAEVVYFGLANLLTFCSSTDHDTNGLADLVGTPSYFHRTSGGHSVDPRSDIFSLGSILYESVTGRHPFRGASRIDTMRNIVHSEPEWSLFDRMVSDRRVRNLARSCLAKSPQDRPAARELADVLGHFEGVAWHRLRDENAGSLLRRYPGTHGDSLDRRPDVSINEHPPSLSPAVTSVEKSQRTATWIWPRFPQMVVMSPLWVGSVGDSLVISSAKAARRRCSSRSTGRCGSCFLKRRQSSLLPNRAHAAWQLMTIPIIGGTGRVVVTNRKPPDVLPRRQNRLRLFVEPLQPRDRLSIIYVERPHDRPSSKRHDQFAVRGHRMATLIAAAFRSMAVRAQIIRLILSLERHSASTECVGRPTRMGRVGSALIAIAGNHGR